MDKSVPAVALFSTVLFLTPASAQDGSYAGIRNLAPGMPNVCKPTSISGSVNGTNVRLVLAYNGATLTGTMSKSGSFVARGSTTNYGYVFSGSLKSGRMSGNWHSVPKDCSGTWSARKA